MKGAAIAEKATPDALDLLGAGKRAASGASRRGWGDEFRRLFTAGAAPTAEGNSGCEDCQEQDPVSLHLPRLA